MMATPDNQRRPSDLGIDANEDITTARDGIAHVAQRCSLIDVMQHFHGPNLPPTYAHSGNRLDYRFVSNGLLRIGAIRRCGSLALNYGIISDHTGIFIDYDEEAMIRTNTDKSVGSGFWGARAAATAHKKYTLSTSRTSVFDVVCRKILDLVFRDSLHSRLIFAKYTLSAS